MDDLNVTTFPARAGVKREKLHPTITPEQISDMVDTFYDEVFADPRLGPIFKAHTTGPWSDHLAKMKMFWRSVLLRSAEYKGKPVPAHQKIDGLQADTFQLWLSIFAPVCRRIYTPDAAELVIEAAQRIATSLWLSRSNDIFAKLPVWSTAPTDQSFTDVESNAHARS